MFVIIIAVFVVFAWLLEAYSFEYKDIRKMDDIGSDTVKDIKRSVDGFRKSDIESATNAVSSFKKPRNVEVKKNESGNFVINDNDLPSPLLASETAKLPEGKVYFFFSFSLPTNIIKQAILDSIKLKKVRNVDVVLVLRGLVNNDFRATFEAFYNLKQDSGLSDADFPAELNPDLFSKYSVTSVPYIVYESLNKVGTISGASISFALSKFKDGIKDYGKYGEIYPVEEEDFLQFIEARAKSPAVQAKIKNAFQSAGPGMYKLSKYNGRFSKAEKDRVYRIDPAVKVTDDIMDHEGNVLFKKGTIFNPVEYVFLTGRYIFIDGNDEKQVLFALKDDYKKIILTSGNLVELSKKYQRRFYFVNDILIDRFQLTHVPAILEQEGAYFRVTEKAL